VNAERIEKRIFKTIEKHRLAVRGDRIFVALSGGKDSATALFALKEFIERRKLACELKAFHVNLCLAVSERIQKLVEKQSRTAGVELETVYLKDMGIELESIAKKTARPICSVCGVVKRYLMNKIPREMGATKLATGHNMDDFLVFFFKNFLNKNFEWIAKFKPKLESEHPKLLAKIRPLFYVGDRECEIFCRERGIEYAGREICPYSAFAIRKERKWRETLYEIERVHKNFRYRMAKAVASASGFFSSEAKVSQCMLCGEPTSRRICGFCKLKSNHVRK